MTLIEEALTTTTDTKACVIGPGAVDAAAKMFGELFPDARKAIVIDDPRTRAVAGERVVAQLAKSGVAVAEHVINPDGSDFHATYEKVEEVREAINGERVVPVAVGSGVINDLTKRACGELGLRYTVVGTAASMDGYTA